MTPPLTVKQCISAKGWALNTYLQTPGAFTAELYAAAGWDFVSLDLQHGLIGYESAVAILQAIRGIGVTPLVRTPTLDGALIGKLLDAGALGITCAMINTAEEADQLVRACKYPPRGDRSLGPIRALQLYGADYGLHANGMVNVFAMIETAEAVANIAEIAAVEGLDGIYIGIGDLALSMGQPARQEGLVPEVDAAIERSLRQCQASGLIPGLLAPNPEHAWRMVQRGFQFITLASDAKALIAQARRWVDGFHSLALSR